MKRVLLYLLFGFVFGCSENNTNENRENAFGARMESVDKAEAVERKIEDAAARQRQAIDDQGG